MSETSSSSSTTSGGSTYIPDYQQAPFLLDLANLSKSYGQNAYNWAGQQFGKTSGVTDQTVQNYLDASMSAKNLAAQSMDRYQNRFAPLADQAISDANTYNSEDRIRQNMGEAASGVGQAFDAQRQNLERNLQSYGIDPSSGRYAELERATGAQRAAAQAGAAQQARVSTENTGRGLRSQALQLESSDPGNAVNALNAQSQALSGAENSILANANTGANLMRMPNDYLQTASRLQYPPLGHNNNSNTSSFSSGSGPSSGSGGGERSGSGGGGGGSRSGGGGDGSGGGYGRPAYGYDNTAERGGSGFGNPRAAVQNLDAYWAQQQKEGNLGPEIQPGGIPPESPPGGIPPESPPGGIPDEYSGTNFPPDDTFSDPFGSAYQMGGGQGAADYDYSGGWGDNSGYGGGQGAADYDYSGGWGDNSVGGYSSYGGGGGDGGYGGDYGGYGGDAGGYASSYGGSYDSGSGGGSADWTDSSGQGTDFNYAEGGAVDDDEAAAVPGGFDQPQQQPQRPQMPMGRPPMPQMGMGQPQATTGGFVSQSLSPSQGKVTDDIPAQLNANEFVIPRDVALWKGQEFFQKMIEQSRKARGGAPAKPTPQARMMGMSFYRGGNVPPRRRR